MSEVTPGVTQVPDELIVMPVEKFFELLREQLDGVPYVALNHLRSIRVGPVEGEEGHSMANVIATGFHLDDLCEVPGMMKLLTGADMYHISTATEDTVTRDLVNAQLGVTENEGALPVINPPLPTHPEMLETDDDSLMQFG